MMYFCHEDLILSLQTVQTLMKCMCIVVAFHEGLHCLPKNLFAGTCIQNERVNSSMISFGAEAAPTPPPQIVLLFLSLSLSLTFAPYLLNNLKNGSL